MNETPAYTHFNFQNEEDLSFGMFDVPGAASHHGFHHSMQPEAFADAFSLHAQTPTPIHISAQNSPFGFLPRSLVASYDEHVRPSPPYLAYPKLESPDLSHGSSSTPETNESQRLLVTPNNASALSHAAEDETGDVEVEEAEEKVDFDDDPPLLSSTSARRNRLRGKQQHRATATTTMTRESAASEVVAGDPKEKEGKRRHFLQRNRVAAMKCRKKKKEWVNDLEETKTGLESQNTHLHMELDGLVGEVSRIRAQLMAHANCNDANIDKWLENEAKRFVIGTGERYDQILAHAAHHFGNSPALAPQQQQHQEQDEGSVPSSSSTEYAGGSGGPILLSPLATPSSSQQLQPIPRPHSHPGHHNNHHHQVPSSPAFYAAPPQPPSMSGTPGCCYGGVPPHEAARFSQGLGQTTNGGGYEEPDYDGMPISLYDDHHQHQHHQHQRHQHHQHQHQHQYQHQHQHHAVS